MEINTEELMGYVTEYGVNVVIALLIFVVGKCVAKLIVKVVKKAMVKSKVDDSLIAFLGNIIYGLMIAFVAIAALGKLGVQTASLAAILAAAGLAVGLSLQGSLSNFAAGVMIILFHPNNQPTSPMGAPQS